MAFEYDSLRVGLFMAAVLCVYYVALRWCVDTWRGKEPRGSFERSFRSRKTGILLLGTAVIGLLCMAYGFLVEPRRLTVTYYEIETDKLAEGEALRIVHIADLHVRGTNVRQDRLAETVASLEPGLILHTGDFFGAGSEIEGIVTHLLQSWEAPQFACKGNLDTLADFDGVLKASGVEILNGERVSFQIPGTQRRITIAGFQSGDESLLKRMAAESSTDTFNIILYHHPQGFPGTWDTEADLMLAGHTHGGQIRLPFFGALITLDAYGKRWESGYFEEHGARLIVSRGIGCEPHIPEVRFLCPPEVIVIDLKGTPKEKAGS